MDEGGQMACVTYDELSRVDITRAHVAGRNTVYAVSSHLIHSNGLHMGSADVAINWRLPD